MENFQKSMGQDVTGGMQYMAMPTTNMNDMSDDALTGDELTLRIWKRILQTHQDAPGREKKEG